MSTVVLILAAGRSLRFGSDKRLARLSDGRTLLDATIDSVRNSGLEFLVCLREDDDTLSKRLSDEGIPHLKCPGSKRGMGNTLAAGVSRVRDRDGVLVTLADMPWISPDTYRSVASTLAADTISRPVFQGTPGHPVGFGSDFYDELVSLCGDTGAREVLVRHPRAIRSLEVSDPGILRDVDRRSDLHC